MARTVHEQKFYSRDQLAAMVGNYAKLEIVEGFYVGSFKGQTVTWSEEGVTIVTSHTPGDLADWRKARS